MYTYTAEDLKEKTFSELKSIARDMTLVPLGDRRCRQNWVDVIVGAPLPLLKLLNLEISPVMEVKPVVEPIEVQAQEPLIEIQAQEPLIESKFGRIIYAKPTVKPIAPARESSPGVHEVDQVQEPIKVQAQEPIETFPNIKVARAQEPIENKPLEVPFLPKDTTLDCPFCGATHALYTDSDYLSNKKIIRCLNCNYTRPKNYPGPIKSETHEKAIVPAVKNSPSVSRKTSTAHQLLELFKSSTVILEDSPTAKTKTETLKSAISLAAKNIIDAEANQNPILTGITFSADFLARYSPPQLENIHYKSDADGQLNLPKTWV